MAGQVAAWSACDTRFIFRARPTAALNHCQATLPATGAAGQPAASRITASGIAAVAAAAAGLLPFQNTNRN
jgi:hypothetical protein